MAAETFWTDRYSTSYFLNHWVSYLLCCLCAYITVCALIFADISIPLTRRSHVAMVARIFYRQSQDSDHYLQSNMSVTRTNYFRILALASIDILVTLPLGIVSVTLYVTNSLSNHHPPFYGGWTADHSHWEPVVITYAETLAGGTSSVAQFYFSQWASTILAFAIFALFGVTSEARASYWKAICTIGSWFGWKPAPRVRRARSPLGDMEFGKRPEDASLSLECVIPSWVDLSVTDT